MLRKLLTAAAIFIATSAAAQEKLTTYTNNRYDNDRVFTGSGFIYDHPSFTLSAEEQSQGRNFDLAYAVQARKGPFSVQLDGDDNGHGEVKLSTSTGNFSAIAGTADLDTTNNITYGGATWSLRKLQDKNNVGAGFVYGNAERRESGYVFGRLFGIFAGHNWASDGTQKFVVSFPSENGMAVRWFGIRDHHSDDSRDNDFSYDQVNFTLKAEMLGGVDSVRALQDKITSPSESVAAPNINPLRFVARADQRGSGFNFQTSRTKRAGKTSYSAEADAYVRGDFWIGANYDNANGDTYGIAAGRTEHPRMGPGRVPFSLRADIRYNKDRKNVSAGLHAAKRWKF